MHTSLGPIGGIIGGFVASAVTSRAIQAAQDRSEHAEQEKLAEQHTPQFEPGSTKDENPASSS